MFNCYMEGLEIFNKYIKEVDDIYESSEVKNNFQKCNWSYSLCSTPLYTKSVVLCGLNWGAALVFSIVKGYFQKCAFVFF
jgi:hypothetical protein